VPYSLSAPFTVIDLGDVGEAAAVVVLETGHAFASYDLAGAQVLRMGELARELGHVLGRPLVAKEVPVLGRSCPVRLHARSVRRRRRDVDSL
jgi:NAD(P)H dehydrogenase (quinone)